MKSKMILLGTVAGLSMFAASQSSANHQGWYIGIEGGGSWVDDNDGLFGINSNPVFFKETIEFDTGWAVIATVGYAFDNNWRVEFEAGYRENDIDSIVMPAFAFLAAHPFTGGDLNEITLMGNVLYDIPLTDRLTFTLGLGAGADRAELSPGVFWGGEDDDWSFAYQAIAGLSYAMSNRLDLTLTYRYLNAGEHEFSVPGGPNITPDHWQLEDLEKHTLTVGLRYDLYDDPVAPPPVVPPAPPPPPEEEARQFVIFFGFDKCNITAEADNVLSEAASAYKAEGEAQVRIVGHTDTMGSHKYNQGLSECRAGAAAKNLASKGVPRDAISTSGRGETELQIQTGDGVKEPQNRRATVDIEDVGPTQ